MGMVRRVLNLFRRQRVDSEIDEELRSHIEMRAADNIAAGMSPEEARRQAVLRFGSRAAMKERVIAADAHMFFDSLWRDLHYAARQLRRSPSFAITAILTLALAIGANVVVFGVLNALMFKAVDARDASRLFNIVQRSPGEDSQSYPDYVDYRRLNSTFSGIAAYRLNDGGMSTGNWAAKTWFCEVSGNYFDVFGAQPELGRLFHASDEHGPNSAPYVVLGDSFWRTRFDADPKVVGTEVEIDKHAFEIIGVAQATFHGADAFMWPDFWMPIVNEQQVEGWNFLPNRFSHCLWAIGKLKKGISAGQATSNLNAIAAQLAKQYPKTDRGMGARLVRPGLMGDTIGDPARAFLSGVMLLGFLVLLAACANLASVFAACTADRSRELAIRLAIGGSRWHVARQLLSESLIVSIIGGLVGTAIAAVLLGVLSHWQPFADVPVLHVAFAAGVRVYGLALLLSLCSGLLFSLVALRQAWRTSPMQAMKGSVGRLGFRGLAMRDLLLGLQIALCTLLVTASLVAARGMQRSLHAPIGFDPEGAVLADTDLSMGGYSGDHLVDLERRMLQQSARIPGVIAVGSIDQIPLGAGGSTTVIYREGTTDFAAANSVLAAEYYSISPGYLKAAATRLLAGRDVTWNDNAKSPTVALVNETFAQRMFQTSSAVGRRFMMPDKTSCEIVGIVEDGKYGSLTETPKAAVFFPLAQNPSSDITLVVRSHLSPAEMAPTLSRVLAGIVPNLPFTIQSWPKELTLALFPARIAAAALGIMGLLAAVLAVTGIFGMAAYSVSKRMKELGIRVALGARAARLMAAALRRPLLLLALGSAAGLGLGILASRLLAQIVYQATPRDPLVLGGAVLAMIALGALALWIPARRALRIHPAELLREE